MGPVLAGPRPRALEPPHPRLGARTKQLGQRPHHRVRPIRAKVASGEYASESEVIAEGLRALQDREQSVEEWLRTEVADAYDEMEADPSRGLSIEQVEANLSALHEQSVKNSRQG